MKAPLKTIAYFAGRRVFTAIGLEAQWNKWWARRRLDSRLLASISAPGVTTFQVVGVPRSGTTLLGACLDNHPDVFCLLEPHRSLLERGGIRLDLPEPLRSKYPSEWTAHPSGLLRILVQSAAAKCVGFKETYLISEYDSLATDAFLKHNVEDGYLDKCIAIVRDPRDSWVSVVTRFGKEPKAPDLEFVDTWNSFAEWVRSGSIYCVRYEDLVADAEASLRAVCAELGLEYDPAMTKGRPRRGLGDRRGLEGDAISQSSVGRYSEELDPEFRRFIESHCGSLMREFDYVV